MRLLRLLLALHGNAVRTERMQIYCRFVSKFMVNGGSSKKGEEKARRRRMRLMRFTFVSCAREIVLTRGGDWDWHCWCNWKDEAFGGLSRHD